MNTLSSTANAPQGGPLYPPAHSPDYNIGYDAYVANRPLDAMQTVGQRRGWIAAQAGHYACLRVDSALYCGTDPDAALMERW